MTLHMKSKTAVRFEWADEYAETTVTLNPDDDEETLKHKLGRILRLAGEEDLEWAKPSLPVRTPGASLPVGMDRPEPAVGNGWAAQPKAPELPEDRQGEWEFIPPEEQG